MIRVTVWNEFRHEKSSEKVRAIYPNGMHETIAEFLRKQPDFEVRTATLDEPEHGLTQEVLDNTDVLTWWGHMAHEEVSDEIVERVYKRVMQGMGLIVLHSGHASKIFRKLMGTTCNLRWREGERERVWVATPGHPIAAGLPAYFDLEQEEMYGEPFCIPEPQETVFLGWFKGGEVFRSGVTYLRGTGAYTGKEKRLLLCVMRKQLVPKAKEIVLAEDPDAFMIVTAASQVLGKGYKPLDEEEL